MVIRGTMSSYEEWQILRLKHAFDSPGFIECQWVYQGYAKAVTTLSRSLDPRWRKGESISHREFRALRLYQGLLVGWRLIFDLYF